MFIDKEVSTKEMWENKEREMVAGAYHATEETQRLISNNASVHLRNSI